MSQLAFSQVDDETSRTDVGTVPPNISVIVVSFNTRDLLRQCILTLEREAAGLAYETIVVDNASRDGSADMVAAEFPHVNLIRSSENLGFAAANNRAFSEARGRYLVLLNSDAFLRRFALQNAIARMEENPRAGVGGGRLVGLDDSWQPSARMFPSLLNTFLTISGLASRFAGSRFLGRADRTWADPSESSPVDWVPGAFSVVRRQALEQVGYFDERFFLYYEEIDLCRRIKSAGYEIWYWPDVVVSHLGGQSSKTLTDLDLSPTGSQLTLWRMRSELLFRRKHYGLLSTWAAMQLEIIWNLLRIEKNRLSHSEKAEENSLRSRAAIDLMNRAWRETRGGKIAPPRPW
jgi:GT2 family glycosyltransferase